MSSSYSTDNSMALKLEFGISSDPKSTDESVTLCSRGRFALNADGINVTQTCKAPLDRAFLPRHHPHANTAVNPA